MSRICSLVHIGIRTDILSVVTDSVHGDLCWLEKEYILLFDLGPRRTDP